MAETVLYGKEGEQLKEKVKQIPMTATSTTRQAELLSPDVQTQHLHH